MANFHAADLWVAVVPDTSKVGPAMQQAGKEADKGFREGVRDIGKSITDDLKKATDKTKDIFSDGFKQAGKKASDSFSDEFKTGVKDVGKVIIAEYGPTIGNELGKAIGGAIGDAIHDIPGVEGLVEKVQDLAQYAQPAAEAFGSMRDAINATKAGDLGGALSNVAGALTAAEPLASALGVDIKDWPDELQKISTRFGDTSTEVTETAKSLKTFTDQAGPAAGGMRTFGDAALAASGPIGITVALGEEIDRVFTKLGIAKFSETPGSLIWFLHELANGFKEVGDAWNNVKDIWKFFTGGGGPSGTNTSVPNLNLPPSATTPTPGVFVPAPTQTPPPSFAPPDVGGHQIGGPVAGPGAIGKDSVLMFGAPGEHMLTADEVSGAGGHQSVYGIRALMKAGFFRNIPGLDKGGAVGGKTLNTSGAQVDTIAIAEAILKQFGLSDIGMYRGPDGYNEHSSGEAADVMISDKAIGDAVKNFALKNAAAYGVLYCLWQQRQWNPDGSSSMMSDRGSPTQNHMDHVHIRTAGGGYPKGGGPGAAGAGSMPAGTSSTPAPAVAAGNMPGVGAATTVGYGGGAAGGAGGGAGGTAGGGAGGGGGGAQTGDQLGQELGQGLVTGALQALGIDGSVFKSFTGKGPLDWGITKLGTGLLNWGLGGFGTGKGLGALGGGAPGGVGGGALSALGINIPGTSNVGPGDSRAAAGLGGGNTYNVDQSFNVHGVGSVQEQQQAYNSSDYAAQTANLPG